MASVSVWVIEWKSRRGTRWNFCPDIYDSKADAESSAAQYTEDDITGAKYRAIEYRRVEAQ